MAVTFFFFSILKTFTILLFWPEARIPDAAGFHSMNFSFLPAFTETSSVLRASGQASLPALALGIFQSWGQSMGVEAVP